MFSAQNFRESYCEIPGSYTAGEAALVSSPLFQIHHLRLYRLEFSFIGSNLDIRYVIVKDHIPVLEFRIGIFRRDDGYFTYPDRIPICLIRRNDMMQGKVDDVLTRLEPLLKDTRRAYCPQWMHCNYVPVPPECHESMARLHMIRKQTDHVWFPTAYGSSLGLIDGYMEPACGKPCHTFFIDPKNMQKLFQTIAWERTRWQEAGASLSLTQRLERIRQGLPCDSAYAAELIRAFGAISLKDCMSAAPETASLLPDYFDGMDTYQEAADYIYQTCAVSSPISKDILEFTAALILPIFSLNETDVSDNPAARPVRELMRQPFPSVLTGAALAAGQPCLLQNIQFILDNVLEGNADKLPTICEALTHRPYLNMEKEQVSYSILFHLFVEPFALLNQSEHHLKRAPKN